MASFPALDFLLHRLEEGTDRYRFQPGVEEEAIKLIETAYSIAFPPSYREFLQACNGGMITEEPAWYYQDMTEEEPDGPLDSSFYLFPLERVHERYTDLMLDDWLMAEGDDGVERFYPIIPIGESPDKRLLFVFSQPELEKESPVYISLKQERGCAELSASFPEFLSFYLKHGGFPPLPNKDEGDRGSSQLMFYEMLAFTVDQELPRHAVERYSALSRLFPSDAWYLCQRGLAYEKLAYRQKALQDYNEAIRMDDTKAFYRYCRGDLLLSFGNPRQALIDLDVAVRLEPQDPYYLSLRAHAFFELGHLSEALEDCNTILEAEPFHELGLELRYQVYRALGEHEKAAADAQVLDNLNA